jgi:hypothetical protein
MTIIDLLADGATKTKQVLTSYQPKMTKEEYITFMDSIH